MSPIDRCALAFVTHDLDFAASLERNYQHGFVFSTPEFFIMGREIEGAWFIEGMAGDMSKAWSILPWPLDWISFERFDNELHIYRTEDLKRLTTHEMATPA